jgi:hypothetical protein
VIEPDLDAVYWRVLEQIPHARRRVGSYVTGEALASRSLPWRLPAQCTRVWQWECSHRHFQQYLLYEHGHSARRRWVLTAVIAAQALWRAPMPGVVLLGCAWSMTVPHLLARAGLSREIVAPVAITLIGVGAALVQCVWAITYRRQQIASYESLRARGAPR